MSNGIEFFRCCMCNTAISPWDIDKHHSCPKCGGIRIRPSNLSWFEKLVQIVKHPQVWKWSQVRSREVD